MRQFLGKVIGYKPARVSAKSESNPRNLMKAALESEAETMV
jgi:hypothetical protein